MDDATTDDSEERTFEVEQHSAHRPLQHVGDRRGGNLRHHVVDRRTPDRFTRLRSSRSFTLLWAVWRGVFDLEVHSRTAAGFLSVGRLGDAASPVDDLLPARASPTFSPWMNIESAVERSEPPARRNLGAENRLQRG